jgi:hypothetical protein
MVPKKRHGYIQMVGKKKITKEEEKKKQKNKEITRCLSKFASLLLS